jgi:hypothetical protein
MQVETEAPELGPLLKYSAHSWIAVTIIQMPCAECSPLRNFTSVMKPKVICVNFNCNIVTNVTVNAHRHVTLCLEYRKSRNVAFFQNQFAIFSNIYLKKMTRLNTFLSFSYFL